MTDNGNYPPVLAGVRVLDLSHQYSGALCASLLADLGADVVVVERPDGGSPTRSMLPRARGESMWWKVIARGKKTVTLDLRTDQGREMVLKMARQFDIIIENFRPGTLEKWGLGPQHLEAAGLDVLMLRISGFGQTGPASHRPGFGTAAEAFSGFANLTGEPDGPPTFSSTTLADGVTAVFGAFGLMAALANKRAGGSRPSVEVVDMALYESLFRIIPTQMPGLDIVGEVATRPGNSLFSHGSLRNLYQSCDGRYFIVAAVGATTMKRVMTAVGASEMTGRVDDAVAQEPAELERFLNECDVHIRAFAESHTFTEVAAALEEHGAVFQPVYTVEDIAKDEQYAAREDLVRVPDAVFGDILMQGVMPKFHGRTHEVTEAGRALGQDNVEVYGELLSLDAAALAELQEQGVV